MMPKMGIMMMGLARAVTGEGDQISYNNHISSTRLAPFIFQCFHELLGLMTQTCYLAFSVIIKNIFASLSTWNRFRCFAQLDERVSELAINSKIRQPRASVK